MAKDGLTSLKNEILFESPGCALLVSGGKAGERVSYGGRSLLEPKEIELSEDTLFDLASLTKPLCTALLALKAHSSGHMDIFGPVAGARAKCTPLDILRHEAGFPAWEPLYRFGSRGEAERHLLESVPLKEPGTEAVYSCPGYILLGFLLEKELGAPLDELFDKLIREPLGIGKVDALFRPAAELRPRIAGTEIDGGYEKERAQPFGCSPPPVPGDGLWGTVNDGNARFLGGVAGNAGLFATLRGTFALTKAFLRTSSFLPPEILGLVYNRGRARAGELRSAGFKMKGSPSWETGEALPEGSIAHEGFTGTFAAITGEGDVMILLTNRIHPRHPGKPFTSARISFIKGAAELLR